MYRNDLYSNTSESRRSRGGSWVYINGELYHAGVKGMKWYQHLPGTDWWKTTTATVSRAYNAGQNNYNRNNPNGGSRIGSTISGIRNVGSVYGRLGNYHARKAYNAARTGAVDVYNKAKIGVNRVAAKARTYRDKAIMKGYQVKRAVTGKINNATYKAKKIASKYANKALSSIKSTASAYKNKVTNFLNKFMGRKSTTITLESKPIQRSNSLVGKPIETAKASGTQRRRPDNKMEQIARKVEREKSDSNWVSKPVNRKVSISSKRSPYYKG